MNKKYPFFIIFIFSCISIIKGQNQLIFSHNSGYYYDAFDLTISSAETSDTIVYTLDGSKPETSLNPFKSIQPINLRIHPDSILGRGKTPGFIVKASIKVNEDSLSLPVSKTYLFPEKIFKQTYPGAEWPSTNINSQRIEYDMDQTIVQNSTYIPELDGALFDLPVISLSTDLGNLFNSDTGIIVNAGGRGIEWERECSVEFFNVDGSEGFQANAGLRIRGGSSRSSENPKHSFRLFFRNEYGQAKLDFPLFGDEGAAEFDKIDLRTAQNYSWNADWENNHLNTLVRDIFSRDLQREMNQPYSRGRYYHLFLNGMYWGIFQTDERTEARYASTYFGDSKEDYDVIKVTPEVYPYYNEVTDGNDMAWREIWNLTQAGFVSNEKYFNLEGKDKYGNFKKNTKVLVNIDNLIDYMLLIFYTGNFDAPTSAFDGNKMPNNYYALYNRKNLGEGFIFCVHDSEHSLMIDPVYAGVGLYEDRVNIINAEGWFTMECTEFINFNPQWLHYKLSKNNEYRSRFADRSYPLFEENGLFTPQKAIEIFNARVAEIDTAIVLESARWGDARVSTARTKYDDWLPQINSIQHDFFPYRTEIVKQQLKEAYLYTRLIPPLIKESGNNIPAGNYSLIGSKTITLENSNGKGEIYYTLTGKDPRNIGGAINDEAINAVNGTSLQINNSTIIYARIRNGSVWSSLKKLVFYNNSENYSDLKVTELHYDPIDDVVEGETVKGKNFEFIEFKNIGNNAINLSGLVLDSAVSYIFPENTFLAPDKFYVIASKPEEFYRKYGRRASGNFSGNLSNDGEYLLLTNTEGEEILSFTYGEDYPWPVEGKVKDFSIVSVDNNPQGLPSESSYWRSTYLEGGSPFMDDTLLLSHVVEVEFADLKVFPNPTRDDVTVNVSKYEKEELIVELISPDGKLLKKMPLENGYLKFSMVDQELSYGFYMLKLTIDKSNFIKKILFIP